MEQKNETIAQQPMQTKPAAASAEIQAASLELQLAQTRSAAEFNNSCAGQIQRQFEAMQRIGKAYAESTIVPKVYQNNIGNCIIALEISHRMNVPPLMVMQNLYVANGNPSWSSKFLVATINSGGRYSTLRYRKRNLGKVGKIRLTTYEWDPAAKQKRPVSREFDGSDIDNIECVAYATEKATGEVLESDPVTIEMAVREGWYTKDGSKWVTMPQLMLTYRAAAFWQRVYAPEVSMGFATVEEETDIQDVQYEEVRPAPPRQPVTVETVNDRKEELRSKTATPAASETQAAAASQTPEAKQAKAQQPKAANTGNATVFDMP